ncbi:efflux RND transporter periplasmic adaptor subunit [Pedobacter insulae]|uniref:RND family efflux transporter, MFP subunit n=1 Tax=Pedobacter insulae TaxID=414048 RepID=A0A1I2ZFC8_9SPHI|nr:efflux RND transporter periplasmic adaptor subunit [Pedobacter insulae]SFH35821.1 RND family efflux transporter, MFP subunit [Pedobacter insulae]
MRRILLISTIAFLAACSQPKDKKTELADLKKQRTELDSKIAALETEVGTKDSVETKEVSVLTLETSTFRNYVEIQGRVDAEQNVSVNPETQGIVKAVYANIGQSVSAGQVLAQIDDNVLRQSIAQLQTQIDLATNLYNRQKNLWDQKIGTEVQFLNAKTQKEGLERQMGVLRSQQSMYKIKSPISGTIEQMDLKVGQTAMPGMSAIRVVNANNLKAKALVAESYLGKIGQGDDVRVIFPDLKDSLTTKVSFASRVIDPASRSFSVEVKLPSNKKYRANMIAILKVVDYANSKALVIPVNVIQKSENGSYVFISENGKAKRAEVTIGRTIDGKSEILSGLKVGDKLIVTGAENLNEGDPVKF